MIASIVPSWKLASSRERVQRRPSSDRNTAARRVPSSRDRPTATNPSSVGDHVGELALPRRRPGAGVELAPVRDAVPGLAVHGRPDRHVTVGRGPVRSRHRPRPGGRRWRRPPPCRHTGPRNDSWVGTGAQAGARRYRSGRGGRRIGPADADGGDPWSADRGRGGERDGRPICEARDRALGGLRLRAAAERGERERPGHPGRGQDQQRAGAVVAPLLGPPEGIVDVAAGPRAGATRRGGPGRAGSRPRTGCRRRTRRGGRRAGATRRATGRSRAPPGRARARARESAGPVCTGSGRDGPEVVTASRVPPFTPL